MNIVPMQVPLYDSRSICLDKRLCISAWLWWGQRGGRIAAIEEAIEADQRRLAPGKV